MKKTLLIITLFIGLGNVNAQSDATLDETIQWLNTYGIKENSGERTLYKDGAWSETMYNWNVFLNNEGIATFEFTKRFRDDVDNNWRNNNSNTPTTSGTIMEISRIGIKPSSAGYRVWISRERPGASFYFNNKNDANSLFKALKHLSSFYKTKIEFTDLVSLKNKF
jgi:hypothetical protein